MAHIKAEDAKFRKAGRLRNSGKSIAQIGRELGMTKEEVAKALFRYDNTMMTIEHGKPGTYTYYGCRCVECISATTSAAAERRERIRQHPELVKHGTYTGYYAAGCRCLECRAYGDPRVEEQSRPIVADAPMHRQPWTEHEVELLHDYSLTAKELAVVLGRTPGSVRSARRMAWRKFVFNK